MKERGGKVFRKICPSPILCANCAVRRTPLRLRPWFYIVQGLTNVWRKNSESISNCGMNFFIVLFHSSIGESGMNVQRLCKLRKRPSYRWPWGNGFNKTATFLNFPIAKGGTRTIAHLLIAEGWSFRSLDRRIYDCKLRNEKKGLIHVWREFHPGHLNWLPN
jgi:hypothetical protein